MFAVGSVSAETGLKEERDDFRKAESAALPN
jgi:hypothetical protein